MLKVETPLDARRLLIRRGWEEGVHPPLLDSAWYHKGYCRDWVSTATAVILTLRADLRALETENDQLRQKLHRLKEKK